MSTADELLKLKSLLDDGTISSSEFKKLKNELLSQKSEKINKSLNKYHIEVEKFILDNQSPKYKQKDYRHMSIFLSKSLIPTLKFNTFYNPYVINNVDCNNFSFEYTSKYLEEILKKNRTRIKDDENVNFLVISPPERGLIFTNKRLIYYLPNLDYSFKSRNALNGIKDLDVLEELHLDSSFSGHSIPVYFGNDYIGSIDNVGYKRNKDYANKKIRDFLEILYTSIRNELAEPNI